MPSPADSHVLPLLTGLFGLVRCRPTYTTGERRGHSVVAGVEVGAMVMTVLLFANTAPAAANPGMRMPGMRVVDENMSCTASFAAHGDDGSYYFLTSGHCDAHNGSAWTYGQNVPLGTISVSENDGANRDAAIIRLDPS